MFDLLKVCIVSALEVNKVLLNTKEQHVAALKAKQELPARLKRSDSRTREHLEQVRLDIIQGDIEHQLAMNRLDQQHMQNMRDVQSQFDTMHNNFAQQSIDLNNKINNF